MRFKRLLVAAALLVGAVIGLSAQVLGTQIVTALSTGSGCTAVDQSCATFQLQQAPSVTFQVSGTFVGTLTFEATSDGTNWLTATMTKLSDGSAATTTTGTGQFSFSNTGALQLRARATAWTSGTATVTATRGYALAKLVTGGSGGIGTVTSVAMTVPSVMSVAGSPVTTSGTLAVSLATETANTVFAGGTSGGAATPTFRALVAADLPSGPLTDQVGITIDGAGSAITTGTKGFITVPYACTITKVTVLSTDASATAGSIVIDIWKDTYANYPPTVADTITAAAKPTLSSANKSQDTTLTGWTTSIAAGSVLAFNVDSASTVTRVTLILQVTIG